MIMVRGRRIFMLRACVILVLAMAVLSRAYTPKETYIKSIREEWGIILPATEWEVYNEAIGSSFAGKGVRYHVFRYRDTSAIQKAVAWHRGRNMLVERKIDLTNVMIALRAGRMGGETGRRTLADFFLPGGTLAQSDLAAWSAAGEDELLERLYYTGLERFAKSAAATDRTLAALERAADDDLMETAREAKLVPVGAEIPVGYLIGREYEVKNLRILLAGKSVGLPVDALRERMRLSYV